MKTYGVLALAIFAQAIGNVCLSKGMKAVNSGGSILTLFSQAVESPAVWVGTALLLFFFLLFAAALSWEDLSFVVPAISVEVVINVAFAQYFLKESVSWIRWLGALLIAVGVILILGTGKRAVKPIDEENRSSSGLER